MRKGDTLSQASTLKEEGRGGLSSPSWCHLSARTVHGSPTAVHWKLCVCSSYELKEKLLSVREGVESTVPSGHKYFSRKPVESGYGVPQCEWDPAGGVSMGWSQEYEREGRTGGIRNPNSSYRCAQEHNPWSVRRSKCVSCYSIRALAAILFCF